MITRDLLLDILKNIAAVIKDNRQFLTDLDAAIGDGDHGINMNKGFKAVEEKLDTVRDKDCGTILKTTAMTLISTVGGASGPLYGTAFLKAAMVVNGKMEIDNEDIVKMFDEGIQGIIMRGKAKRGEKTMLDALIPAYEELMNSLKDGSTIAEAFNKACKAAYDGVEYTKTIRATKGRASYLGDRSIGHQDPGATSSYLIIKTVADTLNR
ncbi:dihydroxyacetone kinase subunit DhaL [Paramaledivibacter caminithermalis]|jgi:dihydroxyacetone kinase-like protein|uniref:phosphoenolpyruvate--glycerone phosphotransferase n=1 Tax=Paramaledivibacter caminithermalis (strain DSM 15212 / CIP 107654 / DViRD3) TaxID=1121301 RepID=A0A1M6RGJ9_PARC5|nr:dihydroxyacetone kinase subunit DhaL [Paramaledivibacter caminithermalis]SHK31582.1 dihydroxyacetone kinase DhaL subunit [Paramaledivibacter caminithermalis DSM 15212]